MRLHKRAHCVCTAMGCSDSETTMARVSAHCNFSRLTGAVHRDQRQTDSNYILINFTERFLCGNVKKGFQFWAHAEPLPAVSRVMLTGQVQLQFFSFLSLNLYYDYVQEHLHFELAINSTAWFLDAGALH